jgi:hypothetical protein
LNAENRYDDVIPEEDENLHGESAFENGFNLANNQKSHH